jgi:hypothetical protein
MVAVMLTSPALGDTVTNLAYKLMGEGRIIVYGGHSTASILSALPDGQELQRQLVLKVTKVIEDIVAKADRQTRGTREIFSIPDAIGILVLINEKVGMLTPEMIHCSLANAFEKKRRELSTLAPIRALPARTLDPTRPRPIVGEGVRSCPKPAPRQTNGRGSAHPEEDENDPRNDIEFVARVYEFLRAAAARNQGLS